MVRTARSRAPRYARTAPSSTPRAWPTKPLEEWAPAADDLEDFTGRFFSDELETFYTFTVEDEALVMRQRRLGEVTLTHGEVDNFAGGRLSFAFERDRNGQVIGFYLSNVRTRDVRFARVR